MMMKKAALPILIFWIELIRVLKHQPTVEKYAKEYGIPDYGELSACDYAGGIWRHGSGRYAIVRITRLAT